LKVHCGNEILLTTNEAEGTSGFLRNCKEQISHIKVKTFMQVNHVKQFTWFGKGGRAVTDNDD
jgi:hypothetical protein